MLLRLYRHLVSGTLLVAMSGLAGAAGNIRPVASADARSGKLKTFGAIRCRTTARIMAPDFLADEVGQFWQLTPDQALDLTFQLPPVVSNVSLACREFGFPENGAKQTFFTVNGRPFEKASAGPKLRKIQIQDISSAVRDGENTARIRVDSGQLGLQFVQVRYEVPEIRAGAADGKGVSIRLVSPAAGHVASLERGLHVVWEVRKAPAAARVYIDVREGNQKWQRIAAWLPYNAPLGKGRFGRFRWQPRALPKQALQFRVVYAGALEISLQSLVGGVRAGDLDKVKAVLAQNSKLLDQKDGTGLTPLHYAASSGRLGVLEFLVSAGANPKATGGKEAWSSLHLAVSANDKVIADYLISLGVDPDAKLSTGTTPLHLAAANGHQEVAQVLLTRNANVNAMDAKGKTPLMMAVTAKHEAMAALLRQYKGVAFDSLSLSDAIEKGDVNKVKLLLAWKPELAKEGKNITPLHIAAKKGVSFIVQLLIEKGADVNARSQSGLTPLHVAVGQRKSPAARALLKAGADVNARTDQNQTALHLAISLGDYNLVRTLMAKGADATITDASGTTPRALAGRHRLECERANRQAKANMFKRIEQLLSKP